MSIYSDNVRCIGLRRLGERQERVYHFVGHLIAILLRDEFVSGASDRKQFGSRGDELQRGNHLVDGAKPVPHAMNKHCGGLELREMRGSQLFGPLRRVERVGEQEESIGDAGLRRAEHRGLPPAIRMTAQEDAGRRLLAHGCNGGFESLPITLGAAAWRWPMGSQLAKRKIAAEYSQARGAERISQREEKRRIAVGSRAVGQNKAIATGIDWGVQEASDGQCMLIVAELSIDVHAQMC
jgi:hypothetical protein